MLDEERVQRDPRGPGVRLTDLSKPLSSYLSDTNTRRDLHGVLAGLEPLVKLDWTSRFD